MILRSFRAFGFRNLQEQELTFNEGMQVFLGANAQGKSNLLEAIYCLASGRSFRAADDQVLLGPEAAGYALSGEVVRRADSLRLRLSFDAARRRKLVEINRAPLRRILDLWAEIKAVAFNPYDRQLVKGPPLGRRQFLNRFLAQQSASYRFELLRYSQALRQRNQVLKALQKGEKVEGLEAWNHVYIQSGQLLVDERAEAIKKLEGALAYSYARISSDGSVARLYYRPSSRELATDTRNGQRQEILAGSSLYGPHLDDLEMTLDSRDARLYSSEGEARSLSLALRLAEYQLLGDQEAEPPLLLLDDAFSELDERRQSALLAILEPLSQVFLSMTVSPFASRRFSSGAIFDVQAGQAQTRADTDQ